MPARWNGKYRQAGDGGWAGAVPVAALVEPAEIGYATAAIGDGHEGASGVAWAIGHPEKLIDLGHRAVHETAVQANGKDVTRSYFVGCSDGGRKL